MCQIAVEWPFDHLLPSQMRKVASLSAQPLNRGLRSYIGLRGSFADLLEHLDKVEIERCKSLDGYLYEIMIDVTLVTRNESDDEAHSLYRAIAIKK